MSASRRVAALDGLRGVAATLVVVRHSFNALEMPLATRQAILEGPLALFLNGQGYVQVFFVLSGYVLASSLARNRRRSDLVQFYVKRFFRIHPPFVFGVLFAWAASFHYPELLQGRPGLTPWISLYTTVRVDLAALLPMLLFPGDAAGLLPVGWTLKVEATYSIALPVMVLLGRRARGIPLVISSLLLIYFVPGLNLVWYSISFSVGIVAFQQRDRIGSMFREGGAFVGIPVLAISLIVFCAPMWLGLWTSAAGILVSRGDVPSVLRSVGAVGIVVAVVQLPWLNAALSVRPLRFLGRISYSLYLLHFTLLILCAPVVAGYGAWTDFPTLLGLVLVLSIPLSALAYRLVEVPCIRLGNRVCRAFAKRFHTEGLDSEIIGRGIDAADEGATRQIGKPQ